MKEVYILLGSNRGDRQHFISSAAEMIGDMVGKIVNISCLYESQPWGFEDPVPFLNQVAEVETLLAPADLLDRLLTIEVKLGRIRPFDGCGCGIPSFVAAEKGHGNDNPPGYSGRTIDLDILFYGQQLIFSEKLMIPHPRLHERRFTLVPLNEIAPGFIHPLLKRTISVLLRECADHTGVNRVKSIDC